MKSKTQEQIVIDRLLQTGSISRNWCLQNFISRLGAIICDLKKEGWTFDPDFVKNGKGKDYVYKVISSPFKRVTYTLPDGRVINTIEKK